MAAVLVSTLIDMNGSPWFVSPGPEVFVHSLCESCSARTSKQTTSDISMIACLDAG